MYTYFLIFLMKWTRSNDFQYHQQNEQTYSITWTFKYYFNKNEYRIMHDLFTFQAEKAQAASAVSLYFRVRVGKK